MVNSLAWIVVRYSRAVIVVSVLVLAGFAALSVGAFSLLKTGGFDDPGSASSRADVLLDDRFGGTPNLIFLVTATEDGGDVDARKVAAASATIADRLERDPDVSSVLTYWATGAPELRAADGRSGLIATNVEGDEDLSGERATVLIQDVAEIASGFSAVRVQAGGELGSGEDLINQIVEDLAIAEAIAIPLTLILLLFAFGSVVAALLPLGVGLMAVAGAFAVMFAVGSVTDISIYAINLTTGLGLGLAIDYALLIVNRFREEIARGARTDVAVVVTLQTAGRTVMFSAAIVAVALLAMLAFPLYFLRSFAYSGVGVVIVAMLASVVTLPALLALLGPRVNAGKLRRNKPLRAASEESRFWSRVASTVMRRPVLAGFPVVAMLLVMAWPTLHITFGTPDDRVLPASANSRQVGDQLRANYGGSADAAITVLLDGDPNRADAETYGRMLSELPTVTAVQGAAGTWNRGVLTEQPAAQQFARTGLQFFTVTGPADGTSVAAQDLVGAIRAVPSPPGSVDVVGGAPAALVDSKQAIADGLPIAAGWIIGSTFVLLFLFTGSVLLPLKAVLLNVLTLSAVFGIVVWLFQDGNLSRELGFTPGPIDTSMPVLLFSIAFGLSMDYEVFLLSRIKEEYDATGDNTAAVVFGLSRTGRIVTTSAALLAVTFFAFGTSQVSFLKLFGIGTALAIVLDATLVRGVLVPAMMRLAGRANWWAPRPLRRLHARFGLSESGPDGKRTGGRHRPATLMAAYAQATVHAAEQRSRVDPRTDWLYAPGR